SGRDALELVAAARIAHVHRGEVAAALSGLVLDLHWITAGGVFTVRSRSSYAKSSQSNLNPAVRSSSRLIFTASSARDSGTEKIHVSSTVAVHTVTTCTFTAIFLPFAVALLGCLQSDIRVK